MPFASERELVAGFVRRVRELDPDALTGWNVAGFDLAVLDRVAQRVRVPLEIGRGPGGVRVRTDRRARGGLRGGAEATVPGRVVLDGLDLVRGAFLRMESYSLDAVAREVLGEGKTLAAGGRAEEIERLFHDDREAFVAYNLNDARLVTAILDKLQLVELAVARSLLTGMPPDRVSGSIASFDFLYLSELAKRGVVAPSVARPRPAAKIRRPSGVHPLEDIGADEDEGAEGGDGAEEPAGDGGGRRRRERRRDGGTRPRRSPRAATSSSPSPASTTTCWSSTSRASTPASSAPSRSTRWVSSATTRRKAPAIARRRKTPSGPIRSSPPTAPPSAAARPASSPSSSTASSPPARRRGRPATGPPATPSRS